MQFFDILSRGFKYHIAHALEWKKHIENLRTSFFATWKVFQSRVYHKRKNYTLINICTAETS